jgi:hypothetical protein
VIWWFVRFADNTPGMPRYVGVFQTPELAARFVDRHAPGADYQVLPIVPSTELRAEVQYHED